jgi:hypothetical protein
MNFSPTVITHPANTIIAFISPIFSANSHWLRLNDRFFDLFVLAIVLRWGSNSRNTQQE